MKRAIVKGKEIESGIVFRLREDGKVVYRTIPFVNYFFIKSEEWQNIEFLTRDEIQNAEEIVDRDGTTWMKLYLKNNFLRYKVKDKIENAGVLTYESDVSAVLHFCAENDLSWNCVEDLSVGYFDLETDDRKPFTKDNVGRVVAVSQILSCAIGPQSGTKEDIIYFKTENPDDETNESEKKLIMSIFDELRKYDVISAWNSDLFDIPYLKQRQEILGLEDYFDWSLINVLDDLIIFKTSYSQGYKKYSLNNVAKQFIGDEKLKLMYGKDEPNRDERGKFYKFFKENQDDFKMYNIKDVELMQMIEAKAKSYIAKRKLVKLTQAFMQDTPHNSILHDFKYLRMCRLHNVVAKRKPTRIEQEQRKLSLKPGGGYTFCFKKGLHFNVEAFDYKSHYPLAIMTFNISPETFVSNYDVDFEELATFLTKEELELMFFTIDCKKAHTKKDGKLKASYDKAIDKYIAERHLKFTATDVMFKVVRNYVGYKAKKYAQQNNYVFTPADYNKDTTGWTFHPHRMFKRIMGLFPMTSDEILTTRDAVKYEIKKRTKEDVNFVGTDEYWSLFWDQISIKLLGNSLFGVLGAIHTRFYEYPIVDSITTAARWIMKKSILIAQDEGHEIIAGDTDSIFIDTKQEDDTKREEIIRQLNITYYEKYKDLFAPFNTILKKEVKNPVTGEKETLNYWCVFEFEHSFPAMITAAKKRYYFTEEFKDESGHKKMIVKTQGGAFLKTDTNPYAAQLQKELCEDILYKKYDRKKWYSIMQEVRITCFGQKLETKYLVFSKKYTRNHDEFGKAMIDKETGQQKKSANGTERFAPIPVHIKLIKRLQEKGVSYNIGDTIEYIIAKPKESTYMKTYKNGKTKEVTVVESSQNAITIEEYLSGQEYDAETYWRRISGPIGEIFGVTEEQQYLKQVIEELDIDISIPDEDDDGDDS